MRLQETKELGTVGFKFWYTGKIREKNGVVLLQTSIRKRVWGM